MDILRRSGPPASPETQIAAEHDISHFRGILSSARASGGSVGIYQPVSMRAKPRLIATMTVEEARLYPNFEQALLESFGADTYLVRIFDKESGIVGKYTFAVGTPKKRGTENDGGEAGPHSKYTAGANMEMLQLMLDMQSRSHEKTLEMLKSVAEAQLNSQRSMIEFLQKQTGKDDGK